MKLPLPSLVLLKKRKKKHSEDKDEKKITNRSAGGHLQPRAKEWTATLPGVLGTAAALSHYSALPQRRDGGWDEAEPHTGHRGCNKSQMCWGDMKIHGQAPLSVFTYERAHMYTHARTHRRLKVFEECQHSDGKNNFLLCSYVLIIIAGLIAVSCDSTLVFWQKQSWRWKAFTWTLKQPLVGDVSAC